MSDCSSVSARSRLFRARPRRDPTAGTSFGSQAAEATGRRFGSPAARISRRYEPRRTVVVDTQSDGSGAATTAGGSGIKSRATASAVIPICRSALDERERRTGERGFTASRDWVDQRRGTAPNAAPERRSMTVKHPPRTACSCARNHPTSGGRGHPGRRASRTAIRGYSRWRRTGQFASLIRSTGCTPMRLTSLRMRKRSRPSVRCHPARGSRRPSTRPRPVRVRRRATVPSGSVRS